MLQVNWNEASTKRGAILMVSSVIALVFLWFRDPAVAMTVLAIGKFAAGAIGVCLPDVPKVPE